MTVYILTLLSVANNYGMLNTQYSGYFSVPNASTSKILLNPPQNSMMKMLLSLSPFTNKETGTGLFGGSHTELELMTNREV